jgi:hypothetical protein
MCHSLLKLEMARGQKQERKQQQALQGSLTFAFL